MTGVSLRSLLQIAWRNGASDWWRFALSLTRNHADAEDLVDEAVNPRARSFSEEISGTNTSSATPSVCHTLTPSRLDRQGNGSRLLSAMKKAPPCCCAAVVDTGSKYM